MWFSKSAMAKIINSAVVYNQLFDRILSGRYVPHAWLKEVALAREFRVSRTPIREALRELEQDGLVRLTFHCGAAVVPFTADAVEEVYDIRKALEMLAIECAVSRLNLQSLTDLRRQVTALARSASVERHAALDERIHGYIVETCQRPRLTALLQQQYRLMQRFRYLGFRRKGVIARTTEEHGRLLDALLRRDAAAARVELARHIESTKATVLAQLCRRIT